MGKADRVRQRNKNQIVAIIACILLALVGYQYYTREQNAAKFSAGHFELNGGQASPQLELLVAATEAARVKGLMYVKRGDLKPNQGMLFVFPNSAKREFWMRNTYIPLDMIFLDENLKVVGVLEDVPILNDDLRSVDAKSQYVVELLAGSCKKLSISQGALLKMNDRLPVGH